MKTVLIVDNSRLVRCVVKQMLSELGLKTVAEAADAPSAIAAFKEHSPDLVALDIFLTESGSGMDVLRQIRTLKPDAKVLVVTEALQESLHKEALALGAAAVIKKPVTPSALKEQIALLSPAAQEGPGKKRALVVDDSQMMRSMVRKLLEQLGVNVIGEAGDVSEGIAAYAKLQPDLVTLDLVMPGGSGADVLRSIMSRNPKAAVVMVTSVTQSHISDELLSLGAGAVLAKPLTSAGLKTALSKVMPAPEPAAPPLPAGLAETERSALLEVLKEGAARAVAAASSLCGSPWSLSAAALHPVGAGHPEVPFLPADLNDLTIVKMTVGADAPVVCLSYMPRDHANRIAEILGEDPNSAQAASQVAAEWANIVVTNVVNIFAARLGNAILVSTPSALSTGDVDGAQKSMCAASDVRCLLGSLRLSCASLGMTAELAFIMSVDFARPLVQRSNAT